ncbi:hypothetical protein C8R47DRAFT_42962 [Mycena vitilis]|nr:hypothetical protein C8R47DRAFT_42962 [Mycena vitilis]
MATLPPELVGLIIHHAWGCLSTNNHRHAHCMARWMLINRDWLKIVLSVVFRDLWITSYAHLKYISRISRSNTSFICAIAGITDVRRHLAQICRSLTISVYHGDEGEYATQCTELIEYATDPHRQRLLPGLYRYRTPRYTIPTQNIATVIRDFTPCITALHFVVIDCTATYGAWEMFSHHSDHTMEYPLSLVELHVTFAYTSPHPAILLDVPRGTFFVPPSARDMPLRCWFDGVRRLVVRDSNADFVAFLTTACPRLERVDSTAQFGASDVPPSVPANVTARLVFVRLPPTATWGRIGYDTDPEWPPRTVDEQGGLSETKDSTPEVGAARKSIWYLLTHVLRKRK